MGKNFGFYDVPGLGDSDLPLSIWQNKIQIKSNTFHSFCI